MTEPSQSSPDLKDDLLDGCAAIAAWSGLDLRRVYYLVETRAIPVQRVGRRTILGSKRRIAKALLGHDDADTPPVKPRDDDTPAEGAKPGRVKRERAR
jgi:hypothetical protein